MHPSLTMELKYNKSSEYNNNKKYSHRYRGQKASGDQCRGRGLRGLKLLV